MEIEGEEGAVHIPLRLMKMLMVAGVDLAVDDLGVVGDNDSSNC